MALSERFPREGASASSDDVAGHGAEFVEREFCDIRKRVSDLDSPAGVAARGGLVVFVRLGRGSIRVGLCIMVRGETNK